MILERQAFYAYMRTNITGSSDMKTQFIDTIILSFILLVFFGTPGIADDSVCAQVKIEIRQEMTFERQAFVGQSLDRRIVDHGEENGRVAGGNWGCQFTGTASSGRF